MNWRFVIILIFFAGCAASRAHARVNVEKTPVRVERRTFDPNRRPADMPELKPGEAALTEFTLNCGTNVRYRIADRKPLPGGAGTRVGVSVGGIDVTIELTITIWLPRGATEKLAAHEEGHRLCGERIYETADAPAREAAKQLDGRSLTGEGVDEESAARDIVARLSSEVRSAYVEKTADRMSYIGDIYDGLTDHGRKATPAEDEAVERAFAQEKAELTDGERKAKGSRAGTTRSSAPTSRAATTRPAPTRPKR